MSLSRDSRIVLIRHMENTYADITIHPLNERSIPTIRSGVPIYYVTQRPGIDSRNDIYLFPFILNEDGSPWKEANLFLFTSLIEGRKGFSDSNSVRMQECCSIINCIVRTMLSIYSIFQEGNRRGRHTDISLICLKNIKVECCNEGFLIKKQKLYMIFISIYRCRIDQRSKLNE